MIYLDCLKKSLKNLCLRVPSETCTDHRSPSPTVANVYRGKWHTQRSHCILSMSSVPVTYIEGKHIHQIERDD